MSLPMHTTESILRLNSEKAVFCHVWEIMGGVSLWLNKTKQDRFAEGLPRVRGLGKWVKRWSVNSDNLKILRCPPCDDLTKKKNNVWMCVKVVVFVSMQTCNTIK